MALPTLFARNSPWFGLLSGESTYCRNLLCRSDPSGCASLDEPFAADRTKSHFQSTSSRLSRQRLPGECAGSIEKSSKCAGFAARSTGIPFLTEPCSFNRSSVPLGNTRKERMFEDGVSESADRRRLHPTPCRPKLEEILELLYCIACNGDVRGPLRNADTWRTVNEARGHRPAASQRIEGHARIRRKPSRDRFRST